MTGSRSAMDGFFVAPFPCLMRKTARPLRWECIASKLCRRAAAKMLLVCMNVNVQAAER